MSEVAGRAAVVVGSHFLAYPQGGPGLLIGGVPGVPPAEVLIVGGGVVGLNAAKMAAGLGARVTILDIHAERLKYLDDVLPRNCVTVHSDHIALERCLSTADLVVGAVLVPGTIAPKLVTREMLRLMKPRSVVVDVAVDQGGCFETTHATTHKDPVYVEEGILHYAVANMPGAFPQTSTRALTNVTFPYVLDIAGKGVVRAVSEDPALKAGVNTWGGVLTCPGVATVAASECGPVDALIGSVRLGASEPYDQDVHRRQVGGPGRAGPLDQGGRPCHRARGGAGGRRLRSRHRRGRARPRTGPFPPTARPRGEERVTLLEGLLAAYKRRLPEISAAMTTEVGIPKSFCEPVQAHIGQRHLETAIEVLKEYPFELEWGHQGTTRIVREPVGVCGLISPWNWPMNQVLVKVAPALAAGCTMVLKPSQYCPLSSLLVAEVAEEAGVPAGVFNLVNGPGSTLGGALASHPLVDMVSITGSTEVGASVARAAAGTIKRVSQELGGKSAYIVFEDVDLEKVIGGGVKGCMRNSGQSCNAPTRMLVQRSVYEEAVGDRGAGGRRSQGGRPERQPRPSWAPWPVSSSTRPCWAT